MFIKNPDKYLKKNRAGMMQDDEGVLKAYWLKKV